MSEPTYRVQKVFDPVTGFPEFGIYLGSTCVAETDNAALAERIAALLTQDDEAKAREGHEARLMADATRDEGAVANRAWIAWERGIRDEAPLAELDALEAAYRAAQQENHHG